MALGSWSSATAAQPVFPVSLRILGPLAGSYCVSLGNHDRVELPPLRRKNPEPHLRFISAPGGLLLFLFSIVLPCPDRHSSVMWGVLPYLQAFSRLMEQCLASAT